jgi:hypothetical protein
MRDRKMPSSHLAQYFDGHPLRFARLTRSPPDIRLRQPDETEDLILLFSSSSAEAAILLVIVLSTCVIQEGDTYAQVQKHSFDRAARLAGSRFGGGNAKLAKLKRLIGSKEDVCSQKRAWHAAAWDDPE